MYTLSRSEAVSLRPSTLNVLNVYVKDTNISCLDWGGGGTKISPTGKCKLIFWKKSNWLLIPQSWLALLCADSAGQLFLGQVMPARQTRPAVVTNKFSQEEMSAVSVWQTITKLRACFAVDTHWVSRARSESVMRCSSHQVSTVLARPASRTEIPCGNEQLRRSWGRLAHSTFHAFAVQKSSACVKDSRSAIQLVDECR